MFGVQVIPVLHRHFAKPSDHQRIRKSSSQSSIESPPTTARLHPSHAARSPDSFTHKPLPGTPFVKNRPGMESSSISTNASPKADAQHSDRRLDVFGVQVSPLLHRLFAKPSDNQRVRTSSRSRVLKARPTAWPRPKLLRFRFYIGRLDRQAGRFRLTSQRSKVALFLWNKERSASPQTLNHVELAACPTWLNTMAQSQ